MRYFSSFRLKVIAIITMVIDHIAVFLLADMGGSYGTAYDIMRGIGRLSFPIFCFLLVEGYYRTKNLSKYMLRLAAFAVISQIPYSLAAHDKLIQFGKFNIFFTLFTGLVFIWLADTSIKLFKDSKKKATAILCLMVSFGIIAVTMYFAVEIGLDYGWFGLALILLFFFLREKPEKYDDVRVRFFILALRSGALFILIHCFYYESEIYALFALIPITAYNGEKGRSIRWFFYVFYPVHLLVIYGVKRLIL